MAIPEQLPGV